MTDSERDRTLKQILAGVKLLVKRSKNYTASGREDEEAEYREWAEWVGIWQPTRKNS
jgi:hypothetical protein